MYIKCFESFNLSKYSDGSYMNCEVFVNKVYPFFKRDLTKVVNPKEIKKGDVLGFGQEDNIRHYAIYIGDDKVIEVPEWGAEPQENSLEENMDYYEEIGVLWRKD